MNFLICSFMGLSQTLPVTSYFKMIDIWMLFTMTVPFLEVVLHTSKEMFKKSRATQLSFLKKRVDVVNVKPAEDQEVMEATKNGSNILNLITSLMLPVISLIFAFVFWTLGFVACLLFRWHQYRSNMTECLAIQPN